MKILILIIMIKSGWAKDPNQLPERNGWQPAESELLPPKPKNKTK